MQTNPARIAHTVPETLAACGISRTTLYKLIKQRKVEAIKLGTRTLILDRSLQTLMASLPRLRA